MKNGLRCLVRGGLGALLVGTVACGGSEPAGPPPPDTTPAAVSASAGGGDTARVGTPVTTPPAVVVRNAAGTGLSGITVTFAVTAGGGAVTGATATTNASGVATVGSWTLGSSPGANTLTATVQGLPPVTFTATARPPRWTVMVYMAADNNLASAGIEDIDEIEAAGFDPEVQVVVQAEFSPTYLALDGCSAPSCFNRPNYNTFRYFFNGQGANAPGPNGSVLDLGNRNMVDPVQLKEFITWSKQSYAAQRYALVLWNHGGGYTGLLEDLTSAGPVLMSLGDLPTALSGVGAIDVLDFDMCLMGGYETLVKLSGLASYAVFSQENEPGEGNPYRQILDALQANPVMDSRTAVGVFVDEFNASYQGSRSSTTKSAYDLGQLSAFESSLATLAGTLRSNLGTLGSLVGGAATGAQAYSFTPLKDIGNFLDSLRPQTNDQTLRNQIDSVKAKVVGGFRVRSRFHNAAAYGANDVSRSNGLSILMPSGSGADQLPDAGPGSFTAYQALYSGKPWTLFLADWLGGQGTVAYRDQGTARFEAYLVWDSALVSRKGDVDLWILEPSGELFIPYLGSVTPNGTLTNDSYYDGTYYEGYLTNRFVQVGDYGFYANLFKDSTDYRPVYDIQYRNDQVSPLTSLYAPNYPRLSFQASWLNDPTPTFEEANAGQYTDLQLAAVLTVSAAAIAQAPPTIERPSPGNAVGAEFSRSSSRKPTSAQLAAVRAALANRQPLRDHRVRVGPSKLVTPPGGSHQ